MGQWSAQSHVSAGGEWRNGNRLTHRSRTPGRRGASFIALHLHDEVAATVVRVCLGPRATRCGIVTAAPRRQIGFPAAARRRIRWRSGLYQVLAARVESIAFLGQGRGVIADGYLRAGGAPRAGDDRDTEDVNLHVLCWISLPRICPDERLATQTRTSTRHTEVGGDRSDSFIVTPPSVRSACSMLRPSLRPAVLSLLLLAGCSSGVSPGATAADSEVHADLVLKSGYVYTVDAGRRVVEAVAIRGNRILAVGSNTEIELLVGATTTVRDLGGRMVMPGIHDTHIHALGTVEPDMCDFKGETKSFEEMVPFLQECLGRQTQAPGDWMIVLQWPFSRGNQPSERYQTLRAALDAASSTHPIMLVGDDGHHGAANSAALALAEDASGKLVGLSAQTLETTFAGWREHIAVDSTGEPSGGINEGARLLVRPELFEDFMGQGADPATTMPRVAAVLASRGITSIQDPAASAHSLAAYKWLEDSGQMSFRVRTALFLRAVNSTSEAGLAQIPEQVAAFNDLRKQHEDSKLIRVDGVKLFADAVLEGNPFTEPPTLPGAAVLNGFNQPLFHLDAASERLDITGYVDLDSPICESVRAVPADYADADQIAAFTAGYGYVPAQCMKSSGVLEHSERFISEYVRQTTDAGYNVHIHALSDAGVRAAVNALEQAKPAADRQGLTQSLAHLQLVHPDEQQRIGALRIYNAFTYAWIVPERNYNLMVIPFIEQVKSVETIFDPSTYYMRNVYPVKAIQDAGGILTWGSDAPVESRDPRPFINMEQAVTRALDGEVLTAANAIDIHSTLAAYTINGAGMLGIASQTGSIESGKLADLIVLDQNLVTLAEQGHADRISETQVLLTLFDGRVVHETTSTGQ